MTMLTPRSLAAAFLGVLAIAAASFPLLDCATLTPLPANTCGNGVVEANEDCEPREDGGPACGAVTSPKKACRLTCTPGASGGCPDGWGCATSGVCAQPTGTFEDATERAESGIVALQAGDFDGDGRVDLLGTAERGGDNTARSKVVFLGERAKVADVYAFPAPLAAPTVRDVDRDGRADLVFGLVGVNVSLGQIDRTFRQVLFPSLGVPATDGFVPVSVRGTTRLLPGEAAEGRLFFVSLVDKSGSRVSLLSNLEKDASPARYRVTVPGLASAIVGRPAWGQLWASATSTCGEVVAAFKAPPAIVVASPCTVLGPQQSRWDERAPTVIALPEPPTGGVVLADVDADGLVDILVPGAKTTYVLKNSGTTFAAPVVAKEPRSVDANLFGQDGVLAAADFNGDGFPDYVEPRGVRYSVVTSALPAKAAKYVFVPSNRSLRWSKVFVGKMNADAYLDFVAASDDAADLEFGAGVPGGGTVSSTIFTPGVVTDLDIGDLDVDGVADVLVTATLPDETVQLAVAFGKALGTPEAARAVGRVGKGSSLHVGRSVSAAADVLVSSPKASENVPGASDIDIAIVLPSGDRQLAAPLLFPAPQAVEKLDSWRPYATLLAPFETAERNDLLAFAIGASADGQSPLEGVTSAWRAKGSGPESFASLDRVPQFSRAKSARNTLYAGTADLDLGNSNVEEAVLLAPGPTGDAQVSVLRFAPSLSTNSFALAGWRIARRSGVVLVDVDGDGARDLLTILQPAAGGAAVGSDERLIVLWGDGKGDFDRTPREVSVPPNDGGGDIEVVGAALVVTGGASGAAGKRTELFVATSRRVLRVLVGEKKRELPSATLVARGFDGLTGMAAGDFDGDGVMDVAVAERGGVRVLRQKARIE
jgi:hypothetical protein